jgi:hypothetical protein
LRLAATEELDPERAGYRGSIQSNSAIPSSARRWTIARRIAAQATFKERGGVWHESCARPDEVRYPEAAMEADSSAPTNIALALARGSFVPGLGGIATHRALPPLATREFAVSGTHTLPTSRAGAAFVVGNCCCAARAGARRPLPRADQDRPLPCLQTDDDAACTRHDQESITQAAMTGGGL